MNSKSDWWSLDWSGAERYRHCYPSPCTWANISNIFV